MIAKFFTIILVAMTLNSVSAHKEIKKDAYIKDKCQQVTALLTLNQMVTKNIDTNIRSLRKMICRLSHKPTGDIKYSNGKFAFVGPSYLDKGSWKYPNGKFAFVGPYYEDKGSWRYPSGKFAFIGPRYEDKGSWKYPNGKFAFVGPYYEDKGSWKYPNGRFAFVGPYYEDKGSWKYPNGRFAFIGPYYLDKESWKYPNGKFAFVGPNYSDRGNLKYPNGKVYMTDAEVDKEAKAIVSLVEDFYDLEFEKPIRGWRHLPSEIRTMIRLTWIQDQF